MRWLSLVGAGFCTAKQAEAARRVNRKKPSRFWQVIIQVERRRLDALGAQEDGHLGRVAHFVKHHVPQQAIHGETLPWPVMHSHNPLQLAVRKRGEVSKGALLYK